MCQVRWRLLHRPGAGWQFMTAPQPVRNAPIVRLTQWQRTPSTCPCDKIQGFLHMSKAQNHCHMTLNMWSRFPLGENTLVLSHHSRGLKYSWPKGITLDAAAIRPSNFWNCLTVSDLPSVTLATAVRNDLLWAGDSCACIVIEDLLRGSKPPRATTFRADTGMCTRWRLLCPEAPAVTGLTARSPVGTGERQVQYDEV